MKKALLQIVLLAASFASAEDAVPLGKIGFDQPVFRSTVTGDLVRVIGAVSNAIPDVSSFVDKSVTNGLASQAWVEGKNYVDKSVTNGLATVQALQDVVGSIPDVSSFVDKSVTNALSDRVTADETRIGTLENAGYVTEAVTNGLASRSWVENKQYATSSVTNGLASQSWVEDKKYVTESITNGLATVASIPDVSSFVDKSVTNGLASQAWVEDKRYVTESVTNGLATISSVEAVASSIPDVSSFVDKSVTNGLASQPWVEAKEYVTKSVTNGLASTKDLRSMQRWVATNYLSVAYWNDSIAPVIENGINSKASKTELSTVSNMVASTSSSLGSVSNSLNSVEASVVSLSSSFSNVSNAVSMIAEGYRPLSDNAFPTVIVTNAQPSVSLLCTTNNAQLSILHDQVLVKPDALDPSTWYALRFPSEGGTFGRVEDVEAATKFVVEKPNYVKCQDFSYSIAPPVETVGTSIVVFDGTVPEAGTEYRNVVFTANGDDLFAKLDIEYEAGRGMSYTKRLTPSNCVVTVHTDYDGFVITNLPSFVITNVLAYRYEDGFMEKEYDLTMGDVRLVDSEGSVNLSEIRKWTKDTYDPVVRGHWSEFDALSDVQINSHDFYFTTNREIFFRSERSVEENRDVLTLYGKTVPLMEVRSDGYVVSNAVVDANSSTNDVQAQALALEDGSDQEIRIQSFTVGMDGYGTIVVNSVGATEYRVLAAPTLNGTYAAAKDVVASYPDDGTVQLTFPIGSLDSRFFKVQAVFALEFKANETVFTGVRMMKSRAIVVDEQPKILETQTVTFPAVVNFGAPVYVMRDPVITHSVLTNMLVNLATEGVTIDGHTYRLVEVFHQ